MIGGKGVLTYILVDELDVESMYVEVFACGRMLGNFAAKKGRQ